MADPSGIQQAFRALPTSAKASVFADVLFKYAKAAPKWEPELKSDVLFEAGAAIATAKDAVTEYAQRLMARPGEIVNGNDVKPVLGRLLTAEYVYTGQAAVIQQAATEAVEIAKQTVIDLANDVANLPKKLFDWSRYLVYFLLVIAAIVIAWKVFK